MSWEDISYHIVEIRSAKIDRLLSTIRQSHVNGGAICACFEADDAATFQNAAFTDMRGADHPYHTFLKSPSVAEALPELKIVRPFNVIPEFKHTVALAMEGELTHVILAGGAYKCFQGSMAEARQISREFMEEIVEGRWLQQFVAISSTPWTEWFFDIAWDRTFIVCDHVAHRFWLICITDTD